MAFVVKDRVKVASTTTGTGTFTLGSAAAGFQDFSVIGDTNTTYYTIVDGTSGDFEVGIGVYGDPGSTLSRDTVLESTNSGNLVNFGAGSKDVFVAYPASFSVSSSNNSGNPGEVLVSNGPNNPPSWQAPTGGASGFDDFLLMGA